MLQSTTHYFRIKWDAYKDLKDVEAPKSPSINDQDNYHKVIKWDPIFRVWLIRAYETRGPLIYVLREVSEVEDEVQDPLGADDLGVTNSYFEKSGCLQDKLVAHLSTPDQSSSKIILLFLSPLERVQGTQV